MFTFEWDDQKAASNLQKHGVSFDGISNTGRLLVVVHTERRNNVRIISARKATRYEKGIYDQS